MLRSVYLRSLPFDLFFVSAIPLVALFSTAVVLINPAWFAEVLLADLALLGYHHVIATYTRLALSGQSIREYKFFIFVLPLVVLATVIGLASTGGAWLISTVYLHWQWWHYTRQSEGIEKSIRFKSGSRWVFSESLDRASFYFVPVAAFLYMSSRGPVEFLFLPVAVLPVPESLGVFLLVLALALVIIWAVKAGLALNQGRISWNYYGYVLSHHVIYLVAYCFVRDVTIGWLAINIWHNLQYITFVWHFNAKRFEAGLDCSHKLLSWLSQPRRIVAYIGFCLILTYLFYSGVDSVVALLEPYTTLPLVVVAYQTINFHHYVVDSFIWRLRKPAIRKSIGIEA